MTGKELITSILLEEEIGYLGTVDGYRLSIEGKEGVIPHIHCVKGDLISCIHLTKIGYANHSSYHKELPRKDFIKICNFLSNENANKIEENSWLSAVQQWNEANSFKIKKGTVNPYNINIIYK